ncbi:MAG: ABC transporter ATP-binding protein [Rhodospirillales bacterium]|jgi:branched-chain amino acid transport system ATP-binding protein|nr:ABC transporter ATP-binding protein [Rhodospirillales bacterium]
MWSPPTSAREAAIAEPLLNVAELSSGYGPVRALWDVSVRIEEGELVTLVGGNGAGKTTLLRTLSGLLPASAGTIRFAGEDITRLPAHLRARRGIVQVPEGRQVLAPMTVEDNLRLGGYARPQGEIGAALAEMYALFNDLRLRRRDIAGHLSGGQQQMLAIARGLMARPRVLLLDEPSMGLSPILVDEVFATVERLRASGTTIFLVEQNAYRALSIADRGYVLEAGRIILEGPAASLMVNDRVKEAYLGL